MELSINENAIIEVVNFDENTSWLRWYLPDFSDCGNINLPEGNWDIETHSGCEVKLKNTKLTPTTQP